MFNESHHGGEEIFVAQFLDVVQVLSLPGHMVLLAVNPLLDELLRGIVVVEGFGQLAQNLDGLSLRVSYSICSILIVCDAKSRINFEQSIKTAKYLIIINTIVRD